MPSASADKVPTCHGRAADKRQFAKYLRRRKATLAIVLGRRRIGKSSFIKHCGMTHADHFVKIEGLSPNEGQTREDQLAAFAQQLAAQTDLPDMTIDNWTQAFQLLAAALPRGGKTVLLLDEISWMGTGCRDFSGYLKIAWDNLFSGRENLLVVLCGSVSAWIEKNLLNSAGFVGRCSWVYRPGPLPLADCLSFWGAHASKISTAEKIRLLSVTGGVPRYLEEIDPALTAEQNIHGLCFDPGGLLFREFEDIFRDTFGRRRERYRDICRALSGPSRSVTQISKALGVGRGGIISDSLDELASAGFITEDRPFSPATGRTLRTARYRLSDNYLRFYLRYVEPERGAIADGLYKNRALGDLPAWDTVMGLQFENLVIANRDAIAREIGLADTPILNAAPYFQNQTQRKKACQVDLLLRTRGSLYLVEAKFRRSVPKATIAETREKIARLKLPRGASCRSVLVYAGELEQGFEAEDGFDFVVPFESLFAKS